VSNRPRWTLLIVAAVLVVAVLVLSLWNERGTGATARGASPPVSTVAEPSALAEPDEDTERVDVEAGADPDAWVFETETPESFGAQTFDGTLVQVLIDGMPASAGRVDVYEKVKHADGSLQPARGDPFSEPIGPDGIASFAGLRPDHGEIEVRLPGGGPLRTGMERRRDRSRPIEVRLGTAQILGRVWTRDGQPASGVHVSASIGSLQANRITDTDGRFSLDHLPAAKFRVETTYGELARGEVREVELGRPGGLVTLQGRLLDALGEPVQGVLPRSVGSLEFVSVGAETRELFQAHVPQSGAYRVMVPAGNYSVRLRMQGIEHEVQAALQVTADATVDFTVPGARVGGLALVAGSVHRFDPEYDGQWVKLLLSKVGEEWPPEEYEALVGRDGRYVFHGVGPGRWQLSGKRLNEPIEVTVSESDRDIELDVSLRPRQAPR
jgi:hypothetical protein